MFRLIIIAVGLDIWVQVRTQHRRVVQLKTTYIRYVLKDGVAKTSKENTTRLNERQAIIASAHR